MDRDRLPGDAVSKRDIAAQDKLAYYLLKGVNKAIRDYTMLTDGDRVAVAVSGGKDSFTLLDLLQRRQRTAAVGQLVNQAGEGGAVGLITGISTVQKRDLPIAANQQSQPDHQRPFNHRGRSRYKQEKENHYRQLAGQQFPRRFILPDRKF